MDEKTFVINDLLSFISCKLQLFPKEVLIESVSHFYSETDIKEALEILLASLPADHSKKQISLLGCKNPLLHIFGCLISIPKNEQPVFVCRNINNIPDLDVKTENSSDDESNPYDFKIQQSNMKTEIMKLTSMVNDLKNRLASVLEDSDEKGNTLSMCSSNAQENTCSKSLAYLQSLIDEEVTNEENSYEENDTDLKSEIKSEKSYPDAFDELDELGCWEDKGNMEENFTDEVKIELKEESVNEDSTHTESIFLKLDDGKVNFINSVDDFQSLEKSIEISASSVVNEIEATVDSIEWQECSNLNQSLTPNDIDISDLNENSRSSDSLSIKSEACQNSKVKKAFICKKCEFTTLNLLEFNKHMLTHFYVPPRNDFECCLCTKKFTTLGDLSDHLKSHNWLKPYKCHLCPYKSNDESRMRSHFIKHLEHKGSSQFECLSCGKVCGTRNSLDKHKKMHKRNFDLKCKYCGLTFPHKSALSQHMTSHSVRKVFNCSHCGHAFPSQHALDSHEKIHFKNGEFRCHICNEKQSSSSQLRCHVLSKHFSEKAFKCDICNEEFTFKRTFLVHRKSHLKGQLYSCDYCNKKFKSLSYLKIHYSLHEGKKPFKCSFCDFDATSRIALKKHETAEHEISPSKCDFFAQANKELEDQKFSNSSESLVDEMVFFMNES